MTTTKCASKTRPIIVGENRLESKAIIYVPRCKMWSCPSCADLNKSFWAIKIYLGIDDYKARGLVDWSFLTITMRGYHDNFEKCVAAWPKIWSRLSSRIRYHHKGVRYVLLPEQHEDGRLHVHMIASATIKKRWIKDSAFGSGGGFMGDSKPLKSSKKAAWYVSKYVGKSLGVIAWPPKFRRIRTSQKWPLVELGAGEEEIDLVWRLWRYKADPENTEGIRRGLKFVGFKDVKIVIK